MPSGQRDRLPTLVEVLSRRTLPPVDLFTFYIYMRDQQRSVDYLDFWFIPPPPFPILLCCQTAANSTPLVGSMLPNICPFAAIMFANSAGLFLFQPPT